MKTKNSGAYLYLRWTENGKRRIVKTGLKLEASMNKKEQTRIIRIAEQMRIDKEKEFERRRLGSYLLESERGDEDFLTLVNRLAKEKNVSHWNNTAAYIREFIGNDSPSVAEISPLWCVQFQKHLMNAKKNNGDGLEDSTISKYLDVLSSCFIKALNNGMITRNPMLDDYFREKRIKPKEKPINFLQLDDIGKLIRTKIPGTSNEIREAFLFSVFTGLRISDIAELTFGDVEGSAIHITMHKTSNSVYIPIVRASQLIIDYQRRKYQGHTDHQKLFQVGAKNVVNKPIAKWGAEAGIKQHFSFHTARRTCAMLLFNNAECEERVVKSILGHKQSRKDIFARYAEVSDKLKRISLEKVSALFEIELEAMYGTCGKEAAVYQLNR